MRFQSVERLQSLKRDVEEILREVSASTVEGPVNWGNLSCTETVECRNDQIEEWLEVVIEEAAPDAVALQAFVLQKLKERKWERVRVRTEW